MGAIVIGGHELIVGAQVRGLALCLGGAVGGERRRLGGRVRRGAAAIRKQAAHIGEGVDQGRVIAEASLSLKTCFNVSPPSRLTACWTFSIQASKSRTHS